LTITQKLEWLDAIAVIYKSVEFFKEWILKNPRKINLEELRGKNLACWCPLDKPCHADILLELANGSLTK